MKVAARGRLWLSLVFSAGLGQWVGDGVTEPSE